MFPASRAACVPVFMATPTSAAASAGASFVPSPVIATRFPPACSRRISAILSSGFASARKSSTPASSAIASRGERVVAGDHHRADPHRPELREALAHPLLDDVLEVDDAERASRRSRRRAASRPRRATRSTIASSSAGTEPPRVLDPAPDRVGGALADRAPVEVDAAHPRLGRERDERAFGDVPLAQPVALLREDDDRAPFRRLVGEARELRRVGELALVDARQRQELGRLAVAERDRAGLVEQQRRAVARRLDRASREREHVAADEPVHAGDPDRREQAADRRRDQGDEQRDEHDHLLLGARVDRERLQGDDGEQEDDRQPGEQDVERDLVRRLLPLGALDERDHPVEEALAGLAPSRGRRSGPRARACRR